MMKKTPTKRMTRRMTRIAMTESDFRYQEIMGAYKVARRDPVDQDKALVLLQAAKDLRKTGKVSQDTIEGCRYL